MYDCRLTEGTPSQLKKGTLRWRETAERKQQEMDETAHNLSKVRVTHCVCARGSTNFVVSGWGRLGEKKDPPTKLHKVSLPWVSHFQCQLAYLRVKGAEIGSANICAGGSYYGGKDACYGDSGGTTWKNSTYT